MFYRMLNKLNPILPLWLLVSFAFKQKNKTMENDSLVNPSKNTGICVTSFTDSCQSMQKRKDGVALKAKKGKIWVWTTTAS